MRNSLSKEVEGERKKKKTQENRVWCLVVSPTCKAVSHLKDDSQRLPEESAMCSLLEEGGSEWEERR